jgi:hypothetical protein
VQTGRAGGVWHVIGDYYGLGDTPPPGPHSMPPLKT